VWSRRTDFLETQRGQAWAWRYRQRRCVHLEVDGCLESKTSSSDASRAQFQKEIAQQMLRQGRHRAFRVPVILQMDFDPALDSPPPAIYSLAKHYLDLLQEPMASSGLQGARILLADDRLVKLLICNYHLHGSGRGVRIRVATFNDFVLNLELYERIINGNFSDGSRHYGDKDRSKRLYSNPDDAIDDYQDHLAKRETYFAEGRGEMWERFHLMNKRRLQEKFLKDHQPSPDQLASVFRRSRFGKSRLRNFDELLNAASRNLLVQALVSIDLGTPAAKSGETKVFKNSVHQALAALRKKRHYMFPLLTTAGVTIIHVPAKKSQGIDLDNLARKIIPLVHAELNPPATLLHALTPLEREGADDPFFERELAALKRVPKDHVTRYQVLELPRTARDAEAGSVRLVLHSGTREGSGPWDDCDKVIREWESDLGRGY
jgi:hypothetical protein